MFLEKSILLYTEYSKTESQWILKYFLLWRIAPVTLLPSPLKRVHLEIPEPIKHKALTFQQGFTRGKVRFQALRMLERTRFWEILSHSCLGLFYCQERIIYSLCFSKMPLDVLRKTRWVTLCPISLQVSDSETLQRLILTMRALDFQ